MFDAVIWDWYGYRSLVRAEVAVAAKRENRSDVPVGNDNDRLPQPPSRGAPYPPATDEDRKKFYAGMKAKS